ncbi:MAG: anti-sigma factor family protein [Bradymonadia bacterium]
MTPNSCEDFRAFIDPYLDDEFDTRERAMFDAHLASCSNCRDFFEQKQWLHNAVRPRLKDSCILPAEARQRIQSQLKTVQRPRRVREAAKRLAKPIPAVALAAAAALFIIPLTGFKSSVVEEVVDQHCQSVAVELPSPESAEVDDWFADKLPFRVATPQFKDQRVMLLGGRISRIRPAGREVGTPAAQIVYQVSGHKMSVLVFRDEDSDLTGPTSEHTLGGNQFRMTDSKGHRVAIIRRGGLTYAVTSTLPKDDMLGLLGTSL